MQRWVKFLERLQLCFFQIMLKATESSKFVINGNTNHYPATWIHQDIYIRSSFEIHITRNPCINPGLVLLTFSMSSRHRSCKVSLRSSRFIYSYM